MSTYGARKTGERRRAKRLGGERVGHLSGPVDDGAGWLQVQVRCMQHVPAWLTDALGKARTEAGARRLGLVVLSLGGFHLWFGGKDDLFSQ